jgi:hypothetical protein
MAGGLQTGNLRLALNERHIAKALTDADYFPKVGSRLQVVAFHLCVNDEAHALGKCESTPRTSRTSLPSLQATSVE